MDVVERILTINLIEKASKSPDLADELGIRVLKQSFKDTTSTNVSPEVQFDEIRKDRSR